jgi:transcriptional regulator with XRE-family HTH domain
MEIGLNIKKFRKAAGLKQVELAKKIGVAQNSVASYETGIRKPEAQNIPKIAKALGVTLDELFGLKKSQFKKEKPIKHGNSRNEQVKQLFGKLSPSDQRSALKHIKLLAGKTP